MSGPRSISRGPRSAAIAIDRRGFFALSVGAGAGLVLGVRLGASDAAAVGGSSRGAAFNPFVRITPDDRVIVVVKHLEMGQGTATGLATLVAEELDAAWAQVSTEFAPADAARYKNLIFGTMGTGGSTAMSNSWEQYRRAGATARAMIVAAAAAEFKVKPSEVSIADGTVTGGGKLLRFGALAEAAARQRVPNDVKLKDPKSWVYIGKSFPRVDSAVKSRATALFTQDISLPDMVYAVLRRPSRFGATLRSFDASAARQVRGVLDVVRTPVGVAVIASSTWAAFKGRDLLTADWDERRAEMRGSEDMLGEYRRLVKQPGRTARTTGNAEGALARAAKTIEAEFSFPFLAHAALEPLDCVIQADNGRATVWTGSQLPNVDQMAVASILRMRPEAVQINTVWAGGSFGRRAVPTADYVSEAAHIAKAWGKPRPVKLVWSREDDMRGGHYRPACVHRVKAGLDQSGRVVAWHHRIAGQPILIDTPFEVMVKEGIDSSLTEGIADTAYDIPAMRLEVHQVKYGVPALWWRSVGHTHTAYVMECMVDELAAAAGRDAVAFRLDHLRGSPRLQTVLRLAAEKAGWSTPAPAGVSRGIAVHESFGSYVAQVAEVRMDRGRPRVERVVAAVDCGIAINPDNVISQMEGSVAFGLSAALSEQVVIKGGVVETANYDTYEVLRIDEMPKVEVHIVPSTAEPTGIGEPGVPTVGPAVANALAAATGKRIRDLPMLAALRRA